MIRSSSYDIDKEVHWACIDEAHQDLRFATEQRNLIAARMNAMNSWQLGPVSFPLFRQVVFAGISLNVSEALKVKEKLVDWKDCLMDEWKDEMLRGGFTIVDCTMVKLATDWSQIALLWLTSQGTN